MTRGGRRVKQESAAVEDTIPPSDTGSFVSSNHGFPFGMMTPVSLNGTSVGASIDGGEQGFYAASQSRRSMAPSTQESGVHIVGKEVQVLVDAINDFRKFGVEHVVQLPELVLVGDQSAGKSSLMGALTEIHLPRASGICTRCPAHIKTADAPEWTCKISLHRSYKYGPPQSRLLTERDVTRNRPFPPWEEQVLVVTPFKTIHDKRDLEDVLKWAQIAILNDNQEHTRYVPGTPTFANDSRTEAKFSPNVVSVEIWGPRLPSLSFFDLPGIFQNASQKEDQYLIKVIENLATKYIKHSQALIICAIPMSIDPALSRTAKVISDLNAEERCIGVLTMADRLQEGQGRIDFENMLLNKEHQLGHGYFVTKLPGGSSSGSYDPQYHEKARREEERFFDTARPWSDDWKEFRSRCGTMHLQHALSQKFASQIKASMPDIEAKIRDRQRQIDQELENLPELPLKDVFLIVIQHLGLFTSDIQKILDGGSTHNAFHSWFSKVCDQFRDTVLDLKPGITVSHPSDMVTEVIDLVEDDDEMETTTPRQQSRFGTPGTGNSRKRDYPDGDSPSRPNKIRPPNFGREANKSDGSPTMVRPKLENEGVPIRLTAKSRGTPESPNLQSNPFADILMRHKNKRLNTTSTSIGLIREKIQEHTKAGLPGVVSPQVYTDLCLSSVQPWDKPCERLLFITLKMLREKADEVLLHVFSKWQQTQLYQQSRELLAKFFDDLEKSQKEILEFLCQLETNNDFTINNSALERYREEQGALIRRFRRETRARQIILKKTNDGKQFKTDELKRTAEKAAENELPPDPFEVELEVAAYVRGYYKAAALRFTDIVCLSIRGKLFRDVSDKIVHYLEQNLDIYAGGEERCRELLEEDVDIAQRRRALKQEKASLAQFTDRLLQLADDTAALEAGQGHGMDVDDLGHQFV